MLRLRRHHYPDHHRRILLRLFHHSTFHPQPLDLPLSHPTFQIWSANTSLGKTLVSAGLSSSFLLSPTSSANKKFVYLKPIQTGYPHDSDSRFLFTKLPSLSLRRNFPSSLILSNSILFSSLFAAKSFLSSRDLPFQPQKFNSEMYDLNFREENRISGEEDSSVSELVCKTLFAWEEAVSPHLAAERESGGVVGDSKVIETLGKCLRDGLESESESERGKMEILCIVETAGGVASPGPSGSLQCDLYRPFRLPGILVGDGRLGGISGTISAYESLKLRGYDVVAVVFEDHGLVNEVPLMSYLRNRVPVLVLPPLPQDSSNDLMEWFDESHNVFDSLKNIMLLAYSERIQRLCDMPKRAGELFWWPFTQHKLVPEEAVTVIDSRCGENFSVYQ
ncbi:hypothetical protein CISIN_1g0029412mg, partial [Citrus sinensis]